MTSPNTQAQNSKTETKSKESLVSKITGGLSWWIGSLTGKPKAAKLSTSQKAQVTQAASPVAPTPAAPATPGASENPGDSVSQDLEKIRSLVKKVTTDVSKTVAPVVSKGVVSSSKSIGKFGESNKKFLRTVLKIFFILILLITVAYVGMKFFGQMDGNGGNGEGGGEEEETEISNTPTPIAFEPFKPSVYAEDEIVLKLEEDIDVLVREISGTNIKETRLNAPLLDYNISF